MAKVSSFLRRHPLVRLFITHTLIGYAISTLFVGGLLGFDAGGLRTLVLSQHAEPFVVLLWFFVGLTFASVQMGAAIMNLADGPPPAGGKRARIGSTLALAKAGAPRN